MRIFLAPILNFLLQYFIVSYAQILRFCKKNFVRGDTIIPLSLSLSGIEFSLVWD